MQDVDGALGFVVVPLTGGNGWDVAEIHVEDENHGILLGRVHIMSTINRDAVIFNYIAFEDRFSTSIDDHKTIDEAMDDFIGRLATHLFRKLFSAHRYDPSKQI